MHANSSIVEQIFKSIYSCKLCPHKAIKVIFYAIIIRITL